MRISKHPIRSSDVISPLFCELFPAYDVWWAS
jgi:hypothetical protein